MTISVVVPSALKKVPGTEERWLERAIRSIGRQTLPASEIIVGLDPGAEVEAKWIRELYPSPQLKIAHGSQKGHQAACNAGAAMATGRLLAFLEDDDIWLPTHLETMVRLLEGDDNFAFASCSQMEVTEDGKEQGIFDFPTASTWLLPRVLWLALGGFDTRWTIHHDNHFLGALNNHLIATGQRRVHAIESSPSPDRPFFQALKAGAANLTVMTVPRLTVQRVRHAGAIMASMTPEKQQVSWREYAACQVLYGAIPW